MSEQSDLECEVMLLHESYVTLNLTIDNFERHVVFSTGVIGYDELGDFARPILEDMKALAIKLYVVMQVKRAEARAARK